MKKKLHFDIKGFLNKKENVAVLAVAVVFCAGLVVSNVKSNTIPLHDGDVLVDSQNVATLPSEEVNENADKTVNEENTTAEENVFSEKKANLELERNNLIAKYDETIKNSDHEAEKKDAADKKAKLTGYMEQEIAIESKILAKNLPSCMVIITDNTITVTADEKELKQDTVTKICSIVMEESGRTADQIIIQSNY